MWFSYRLTVPYFLVYHHTWVPSKWDIVNAALSGTLSKCERKDGRMKSRSWARFRHPGNTCWGVEPLAASIWPLELRKYVKKSIWTCKGVVAVILSSKDTGFMNNGMCVHVLCVAVGLISKDRQGSERDCFTGSHVDSHTPSHGYLPAYTHVQH